MGFTFLAHPDLVDSLLKVGATSSEGYIVAAADYYRAECAQLSVG